MRPRSRRAAAIAGAAASLGAPSARADPAAPAQSLVGVESASRAWQARGGSIVSHELRAQLTGLVLPTQEYPAKGSCATGTGVAATSIYGRTATAKGGGGGVGFGLRGGAMYLLPPSPDAGSSSWWAFEAGSGLDLDVIYDHRPLGVVATHGEPCADVENRAPAVRAETTTSLLVRAPLRLGVRMGLGGFRDDSTWHGVSLGAAWAPSLTYLKPAGQGGIAGYSYEGAELSLDVVTLRARDGKRPKQAHLRVALVVLAPIDTADPLITTLSVGAVSY